MTTSPFLIVRQSLDLQQLLKKPDVTSSAGRGLFHPMA